jgi:hypothetical protein
VLSTRIARRLPGGADWGDAPAAYLLDSDELNADDSNYWIFSEAGLRRLLKRSHWRIERFLSVGDRESDPTSLRDERAFCLAKSTFGVTGVELLSGWNAPEGSGWRWTEKSFSLRCAVPSGATAAKLHLTFYVAPEFLESWRSLTICYGGRNEADGGCETFDSAGLHTLTVDLLPLGSGEVHFTLDHWLDPESGDDRQRGVIVSEARVEYAT